MRPLTIRHDAILEHGTPWARVSTGNLLVEGPTGPGHEILGSASPGRLVAWSGWLADDDGASDPPARSPRTWGPAGWLGLQAALDHVLPRVRDLGATLILRPHARHVLSDAQRSLTLARARAAQGLGILVDPASMLEPAMLGDAEDHLARVADSLLDAPGAAGVVVANVEVLERDDGPACRPCRVDAGALPIATLRRLAAAAAAAGLPVVLVGEGVEEQARALGLPAGPGPR